jgi:hypothetical protein
MTQNLVLSQIKSYQHILNINKLHKRLTDCKVYKFISLLTFLIKRFKLIKSRFE